MMASIAQLRHVEMSTSSRVRCFVGRQQRVKRLGDVAALVLYLSITDMASATLRNLGGSVVVAVPKKVLEVVGLRAGSRVELSVENGKLVLAPSKRPRYKLADLLSQCKPSDLAPRPADRTWLGGSPTGREAL